VHRSHIKKSNTGVNPGFSVYVTTFSWIFSPITTSARVKRIAIEFLT
jgi:hypothetical protein